MKHLLGLAVLVLCMAKAAVSEIYESKTIGEINSAGGYLVDEMLFSDFSCISYTYGSSAVTPAGEDIVVTGVVVDGDYGIEFSGPWLAGEQSGINSTLKFKVLVVPGSDSAIVGTMFQLTASSVAAAHGRVDALETVCDAENGGNRVANLDVLDTADPANRKLVNYRDFYVNGLSVELKEIWILKDITVSGGSAGEFDVTHLNEFTQTFRQTPKPFSLLITTDTACAGLSFTGTIGQTYTVLYTDNLTNTTWTPIDTVIPTNTPCTWSDPAASQKTRAFYKVTKP